MIFVLNWISIPIWASSLNTIHLYHTVYSMGSPGKEFSPMQEIQQTWVWSLNREDSPGRGNGNLLQYSFLENSMDRRVWWTAVHRVTKIGHDWAHIQACLLYISALIPNRYFKISVSNWTLDLDAQSDFSYITLHFNKRKFSFSRCLWKRKIMWE